jgi:hypothetical protein
MEVVHETFQSRFPPLQADFTTADGVTELPLDDGVHGLTLPALPVDSVEPRLIDEFPSSDPLGIPQVPAASDRRDDIPFLHGLTVKSGVGEIDPAVRVRVTSGIAPQSRRERSVAGASLEGP